MTVSIQLTADFLRFLASLSQGKKNQLATAQLLLGAMAALDPVDCRGRGTETSHQGWGNDIARNGGCL